jgi:ribose-phosphate pyrophosphokinase
MSKYVLLSGSSNRPLALKVAKELDTKLGRIELEEFACGEIRIRVLGDVKGEIVYIVQSTSSPAEIYLIELALIADAVKRKGAKKIVAIMPWFGYAPQDKVFREGEPLSSQVVIRMLETLPTSEFVVVDIHSTEVLKMFKKKVTHLSAMDTFIEYFKGKLKNDSWVSVALDNGAVERAGKFAKALKLPLVRFDKSRDRKTGEVTFHRLKGDVKDKNIITFDDYVSTGGTTVKSCDFLKREGAKKCYYCITHLIVESTAAKIKKSSIDKMFITDSISLDPELKGGNIKIVSIAPLIAGFIKKRSS